MELSSFPRIQDILTKTFTLLPRVILNRLEVGAIPSSFDHMPSSSKIRSDWSDLKCGFIKQCIYNDLYCCPSRTPAPDAVRSSLLRTGPMGFLTDLGADFWHVAEDPAPECKTWEESPGSNPETDLEIFRSRQHQIPLKGVRGHTQTPSDMSVSVDAIPWGIYDVIISLDIAVPLRVMNLYPHVLWVYFPADPGTPTSKSSRRTPPNGFDVALTHMHRRFPVRPGLGSRTIDCPYSFQTPFSWKSTWAQSPERAGVMVEGKTYGKLTPDQLASLTRFGPVRRPQGSVSEMAHDLLSSRYYLSLYGHPLTGNGQIEAIMAGCLSIGDPETYVQRSLYTPITVVPDFASSLQRIEEFERSPNLREQSRQEQQAIAEYICFRRPAYQLLTFLQKKRSQ